MDRKGSEKKKDDETHAIGVGDEEDTEDIELLAAISASYATATDALPIAKRKPQRQRRPPTQLYTPDPETKFVDDDDSPMEVSDDDDDDYSDLELESASEEDEYDDEESVDPEELTKEGYSKADGFIVDSDDESVDTTPFDDSDEDTISLESYETDSDSD